MPFSLQPKHLSSYNATNGFLRVLCASNDSHLVGGVGGESSCSTLYALRFYDPPVFPIPLLGVMILLWGGVAP